jgi:TM2 domain-containing membrane protein YozV
MFTGKKDFIIDGPSEKSAVAALLLCIFFGTFGIHRFYVGKWITGILMLLTMGGLGIWYLIDIALIVCNRFTDGTGRVIELAKKPAPLKTVMTIFSVWIVSFYGFIISSIVIALMATGVLVQVVQDQLTAFRTGDMSSAYAYTSSDFQKNTSLKNFSSFAHQYRLDSNDSISIYDRNIKGNKGDITGTLKLKDGTIYVIQYHFQKDGDQWKVFGIGIGYGPKNVPQADNKAPEKHTK